MHDPHAVDEAAEIASQQRRKRGVDLGRRRALKLAERAHDLVRERDVNVGDQLCSAFPIISLVRGMPVGVQQHDRDRLRLRLRDATRKLLRGLGRERPERSLRSHPLGRGEAQLVGHHRRRPGGAQAVQVGASLTPEGNNVGEALGGDQRRTSAAALEQRVGRDRHPVREGRDLLGRDDRRDPAPPDRRDHPLGLVVRRRRRLGGDDTPSNASTASVNVPPTSTPRSMAQRYPCAPSAASTQATRRACVGPILRLEAGHEKQQARFWQRRGFIRR